MEEVARPFRVCLTGAESTGKSELARKLAAHFSVPMVAEYSRHYAEQAARALTEGDVAAIARGQIEREERIAATASGLLILDTDLLSTVVYSRHYYRSCPEWIVDRARERRADLYLLLHTDVAWIADPVRESGSRREELQALFRRTLEEFGAAWEIISGAWDQRFDAALRAIREKMKAESREQK